jgi:hypothetical protein
MSAIGPEADSYECRLLGSHFFRVMPILALAAPDLANAPAGTCQCFLPVTRK